jgi:hypothetical protein
VSFQFPAPARTARQLATCATWLVAFADPAVADTPLYDNGRWAVVGASDPGPDPSNIAVSIDGVAAGNFSELKLYFGFTGAGFPQVFSITGRGEMRASLPPPGEFGGSFWLTRYWDCAIGLVPSLVITQLNLVVDTKNPQGLIFQGAVSNLTSFGASDFRLRFPAPSFNEVMVEVNYTLVATRDFCVDSSRQSLDDEFQVARMTTRFIDSSEKQSDFFRYNTRLVECNGWGCWKGSGSVCGSLHNEDSQLVCFDDKLTDPGLMLGHQSSSPRSTPTLKVVFGSPKGTQLNPQGESFFSEDPDVHNVGLWGNWRGAKNSYKAGKKVGKFQYVMRVTPPSNDFPCNAAACF